MIRIEPVKDASCRSCQSTAQVLTITAQPEAQIIGHSLWLCQRCLGKTIAAVLDNLMGKGQWMILSQAPEDQKPEGAPEGSRVFMVTTPAAGGNPQTDVEGLAPEGGE